METGGVDTLEVSLYGYWTLDKKWEKLKRDLDRARKFAEDGKEEAAYIVAPEGDHLTVEASGVRKGVYCRWVLNWNGCRIAIVNNPQGHDRRLSVHVTIGSLRLMEVGHEEAWQSVLAVLQSLGYQHDRDVPGRVDLCVDLPDTTMQFVEDAINQKRLICRARKNISHRSGDELQTYTRGSGDLLVRIYDKSKEALKDPVKHALLCERRWGKASASAVRVEFQLRNKALKTLFSVQSVADLFSKLGTVAAYCTDWFRVTEKTVDRKNKNQQRAGIAQIWQEVHQAFVTWTGTPLPRTPRVTKRIPDFTQLKQQAAGCLSSIAAHCPGKSFVNAVVEMVREMGPEAEESIEIKRLALAAQSRVVPITDAEVPF